MAEQLPLRLPHRSARGRADFLVSDNNRDAVAWIDRWPDWPAPGLVVHGPEASGKSHLASVWRDAAGAAMLSGEDLDGRTSPSLYVFEHADKNLATRAARREEALFHLLNDNAETWRTHSRGAAGLLITARAPVRRWGVSLPDLASRLAALPAVGIGLPDDSLLAGVMLKLFADRQLDMPADVLRFTLARSGRSFADAARIVDALDAASLAGRRALTIPLARRVLGALVEERGEN